jgi:hypothetical protein
MRKALRMFSEPTFPAAWKMLSSASPSTMTPSA